MPIEMRNNLTDSRIGTVNYHFFFIDRSGDGIRSVEIRGNDGISIPLSPPVPEGGCPEIYETDVLNVMRSRLPLSVEAHDCGGRFISPDEFGPVGLIDRDMPGPSPPLPCTAVECSDDTRCNAALREAAEAQGIVGNRCDSVSDLRLALILAWVTVAMLLAGAAILAASAKFALGVPFIGQVLAALLIAAAIAAFVAALWWGRKAQALERELLHAQTELTRSKMNFREAIRVVNERSCPHCIFIDLSMPC